jgi:glycosyltransferase involved in cell wall biosynthesis
MLNNEFPPVGGGTGTVNHALLLRWAQQTDLYIDQVTGAPGKESSVEQLGKRIKIYRLPIGRGDIHHASNRELLSFGAKALLQGLRLHLARRYDLCFAWSALPAGWSALALSRLTSLPYLVRVCGPDIPGFEERYGSLYPLLTPVIKSIWRGARCVVAKCAGEAEMIHAVDPKMPVTLVPNGVDLAGFQTANLASRSAPLRLICVARLIERKGQHHLIQAFQQLCTQGFDARLDLVGAGDARQNFQALADHLGVGERVRFLGYIPREEISKYYAAADVFVLASYNEGMSVATLEAMASGLPIVVTRTGGTTELVVEGVNGLTFAWGDVHRLAQHLHHLAADRDLVRRMGIASRQRAALFSWEAAASHYVDLFHLLMTPHLVTQAERTT